MRTAIWLMLFLLTVAVSTGCSQSNTVPPAEAEKVPADAPVGEEKPSTDEQ